MLTATKLIDAMLQLPRLLMGLLVGLAVLAVALTVTLLLVPLLSRQQLKRIGAWIGERVIAATGVD